MPRYTFKCTKCGMIEDHFLPISSRNVSQNCSGCNGPSERNVEAELSDRSDVSGDNPRWSWSMGATPQVAEQMLQKHPDLVYKFGKGGGPLLVKNRQEKLKLMKLHGMEEF